MPIIPNIGRRSLKLRSVIILVYTLLIVGSVTMVYPFLIMLSGSIKGLADTDKLDAVPEVAYSEQIRFARFEEDRYSTLTNLSAAYGKELLKYRDAGLPATSKKELSRFESFLKEKQSGFPLHFYLIQETAGAARVMPRNARKFRDEIRQECVTIDRYNQRYRAAFANWNQFGGISETPLIKEFNFEHNPSMDRYVKFKQECSLDDRVYINIDGFYLNTQKLFPAVKAGKIKPNPVLSATCPPGDAGTVWAEFVKHNLNCLFVRITPDGLKAFRQHLAGKYPRGIEEMNRINDTHYASFDAVGAGFEELRNSALFSLYTNFITNACPPQYLRVDTPSTRYREYVGDPAAIPPFIAHDHLVFSRTRKSYLVEAFTRNYLSVIQYIAIYGRAIFNTIIFIGLSILAALLVNPIAAYALSRFNLKQTYSILMFCLATMAFPGAVTMIPNFLLLKHLHLLNTFWALILPGIGNGFSIFILKGFFDSIPKEVYESAMIDGASEWSMFWRFTMALSTPILALITLGAFTGAYSAFMFALIICPDEKMWTLMVWLYQMQQGAHQGVIYASLVLAAVPTLLMFILAQNTIMKGIVIPVEK